MSIRLRPRVVLLGRLSTMPFGGVVWQVLHYLVGLERLGFDTYYVEAHAVAPRHFIERPGDDGSLAAAAFLDRVLGRFGFSGRWALHALHSDGRCYGMSEGRVGELYREAEVVINLHGGTRPNAEQRDSQRLVCVATDPVQLELELHRGVPATIDFFEAHDAVFSFGENYGHPDCLLPVTEGFTILPTRQPVVLELWEEHGDPRRDVFTTVANWTQQRDLEYEGETYGWSKHTEFLKLVDLPRHTRQPLELALSRCPEQHRRLLIENGWRVRDALEISRDIDTYRDYIASSLAEFTVAKDQNVRLRSGWFSDRSATYLAAGRPVVTQDTGFGNAVPTGEGLFAFSSEEEALDAIEAIAIDGDRHRRSAREIAREYFSHEVVLGDLLGACGVDLPPQHRRQTGDSSLRATLVAHRFPPDAVGGVERYTEKLAEALSGAGHDVSVLSRRPGGKSLHREVERSSAGFTLHRLVGGRSGRQRFLSERRERLRLCREALLEARPDVVHVNHVLDLSPGILQVARERGAAVVLTLHDYYFACQRIILQTPRAESCDGPRGGQACAETCFASEGRRAARRWSVRTIYFRRLLGLADRLICPSEHAAELFRHFGAPADRLRVIPNGIWLDRPGTPDTGWSGATGRDRLSLAFLGSVLPHKGLEMLLEALGLASLEAVELTVFGPAGDEVGARRAYARAEEIDGLSYRMFGEYEPEDLPTLLRDVDCVIVPSQWPETFCLVAWEALALGIPAIVSRMGALPDAVVDGVNGFVFDHDRPDRLAGLLRRLREESGLLHRLRAGARDTRIPSLDDHVEALLEVYREALEENARRAAPAAADIAEIEALEGVLESLGFGDPEVLDEEAPRLHRARSSTPDRSWRDHARDSETTPSCGGIDGF